MSCGQGCCWQFAAQSTRHAELSDPYLQHRLQTKFAGSAQRRKRVCWLCNHWACWQQSRVREPQYSYLVHQPHDAGPPHAPTHTPNPISTSKQVKEGKKAKFSLGVAEAKLGNAISDGLGVPVACNEFTGELLRGVRAHAPHLTKVPSRKSPLAILPLCLPMGGVAGRASECSRDSASAELTARSFNRLLCLRCGVASASLCKQPAAQNGSTMQCQPTPEYQRPDAAAGS